MVKTRKQPATPAKVSALVKRAVEEHLESILEEARIKALRNHAEALRCDAPQGKTYVQRLLDAGVLTEKDLSTHHEVDGYEFMSRIEPELFRGCLARSPHVREKVQKFLPDLWKKNKPTAKERRAGAKWWARHHPKENPQANRKGA